MTAKWVRESGHKNAEAVAKIHESASEAHAKAAAAHTAGSPKAKGLSKEAQALSRGANALVGVNPKKGRFDVRDEEDAGYDESKHPRGDGGLWTHTGGEKAKTAAEHSLAAMSHAKAA